MLYKINISRLFKSCIGKEVAVAWVMTHLFLKIFSNLDDKFYKLGQAYRGRKQGRLLLKIMAIKTHWLEASSFLKLIECFNPIVVV